MSMGTSGFGVSWLHLPSLSWTVSFAAIWLVVVGAVGGCCWWRDNGVVLLVLITSKTGKIFVINDSFDKRLKMGLI